MSINELDLILKKDPIISTWPARSLKNDPAKVQKDYLVHAKTHLSLGDTAKFVDVSLKWVSGENKGAFIGAVLGDYGEGKTSFLIHLWSQSRDKSICAIPPFEWSTFEQIGEAIVSWTTFIIGDTHPSLAGRIKKIHAEFRQKTLSDLTRSAAEELDSDIESAEDTVRMLVDRGDMHVAEMSAARLLDFTSKITEIVREAGYEGLLVMLDEPEVAAKKLGNETVQHFVFDLANELHRRQGNYGYFLSMPNNFYAIAQRRFSALPARLEVRGCFPKLGDIYGPNFAEELWQRYLDEFELNISSQEIVSDLALVAIGQIGSSSNKNLSYGPRSVISAFSRMIDRYNETGEPYKPNELVQDILDQEILVKPEYRSKILKTLNSHQTSDENQELLGLLAAFPSGLVKEIAEEKGIIDEIKPLTKAGGPVYRTAFDVGLRSLRELKEGEDEVDILREVVEEIDGEFAPDRRTFHNALNAFSEEIIPLVFQPQKGRQLMGWQSLTPINEEDQGVFFGTKIGAFEKMSKEFPFRAALIIAHGTDSSWKKVDVPELDVEKGPQRYDLFFNFSIKWLESHEQKKNIVEVKEPSSKPIRITISLDLLEGLIEQEYLSELVGTDRMNPLWALNFLWRMRKMDLPRSSEAEWNALRELIVRQLQGLFFGNKFSKAVTKIFQSEFGEHVSGAGLNLIDELSTFLLQKRYPDYKTLIRQPLWKSKIDDYINALTSNEVPLAAKRARDPWRAEGDLGARVLGTSRTNLTAGAFDGFESLIEVKSHGRNAPLEITFQVHPLENEIRSEITNQPTGADRKLKKNGKECWYIPIQDLLPTILNKGYTIEELQKIVDIGKARNSFDETTRKGARVLFTIPLDPEELKAQLRDKLIDLEKEINQLEQLPNYHTRFSVERMKEKIEKVKEDAEYDRLMTRMNKEFEQNHGRLPAYFDRVNESFRKIERGIKSEKNRLIKSRYAKHLEAPKSQSRWGEALGRYVVPNLQQKIKKFEEEAKGILQRARKAKNKYSYSRGRTPRQNIDQLLEAWSIKNELESTKGDMSREADTLFDLCKEFDEWRTLLTKSDQVYSRLMELQQDPDHKAIAGELLSKFDEISDEVADHIEYRNISGLSAHRQFKKRFEEIDQERIQHLNQLKGKFDKEKDKINKLLSSLKLHGRVRETFNPADIKGCYNRLFTETVELIQDQAIDQPLSELQDQRRELTYAHEVLQVIRDEEVDSMLASIDEKLDTVESLGMELDKDWLRGFLEKEGTHELKVPKKVEEAYETIRKSRKLVREHTRPQEPESGTTQDVYELLPEDQPVDLKELVLKVMVQEKDPSEALGVSLDSLAELFKKNCIQIKVERRRR